MKQYYKALEDADACIKLNANFAKGYSRKGLAQFNLSKLAEAKATYQQGLTVDPANQQCKDGLAECEQAMQGTRCVVGVLVSALVFWLVIPHG